MNRAILTVAAGAALVLSMASCGTQIDERVTPASSDATTSDVAPSDVASAVAATAPFVTVDCISGQASPTDAPPDGTTIGPVTGSLQPTGAPAITVATGADPATELGIADIAEGSGAEAKAGDGLTVNYCGVGLGSQALFDSSWANGQPATFPLDGVIQGWQEGVPGMKVGGTRLLVIPGAMGYGEQGTGGIAPNETLIFIVELQAIG